MKLYFTTKELNPHNYTLTEEQDKNLHELIQRVSVIRDAYKKPMRVTSGLRSDRDQQRINPKATRSNHLKGAAVDIADRDGELKKFIKDNVKLLEEIGLWCEDFDSTPTWVHFQIFPPKSGNRFFKP